MSNQPVFKHQEFSIDHNSRKKIVRQDRKFPTQGQHIVKIGKSIYPVDNYSSFGVAIKNVTQTNFAGDIHQATYFINNIEVSNLDLVFARQSDDHLVGFNIMGQPLSTDTIQAVETSIGITDTCNKEFAKDSAIPEAFKFKTYELRNWLESLESKVNKIEKNNFHFSNTELSMYEEGVVVSINQYLESVMPVFSQGIAQSMANLPADEVKKCYEFLRDKVGHLIYKSTYAHRALNKPRGYAGDYEMMNHVYQNDLQGDTLFAKCIQRFFTDSGAARAVRNRADYLLKKIIGVLNQTDKPRILAVASGPAKEIQMLCEQYPELATKFEIHLLDQDDESLKYSQRAIREICNKKNIKVNVILHNLAIKNVISEGLHFGEFDLIYSAGLFDYFTDPVAQFAANRLFNHVKETGELIIGNFGADNPSQFVMESLGDWYLIYRSQAEMKKLFAKIAPRLEIESEQQGVNLFAVMKK